MILSFLAVAPLNISTSLGAVPPPKANGLFSVTFFCILCVSYTVKYSFRDPVESAVRKRVVLWDVLLPFPNGTTCSLRIPLHQPFKKFDV